MVIEEDKEDCCPGERSVAVLLPLLPFAPAAETRGPPRDGVAEDEESEGPAATEIGRLDGDPSILAPKEPLARLLRRRGREDDPKGARKGHDRSGPISELHVSRSS